MKVLDLRPATVRLWERWGGGPRAGGGPAARLAGAVADALVRDRVRRRAAPATGLAVVSVGNLAFGGTGKTPVTAALARDLAAAGRTGAVLTRGYGSRLAGPVVVRPADAAAGDEARLLAAMLAPCGWPVVQARRRDRGLELLAGMLPAGSVVLLEDGHQTARVGRHLDVLILDRWTVRDGGRGPLLEPATGPVAPLGPWRETAAGARRAGIWVIEADEPCPTGDGPVPVAGFVRDLALDAAAGGPSPVPADRPWAALSGIARPGSFETGVAALLGSEPVLAVRCADHAAFAAPLRARIFAALRGAGAPLAVTTEKDWVKLATDWPADLPVALARQTVRWTGARALPELVGERLAAAGGSGAP